MRQENSGKATALNHAIAAARGDFLVCIDADTIVAPDAIPLLVRHFDDPAVGAVAGNIKVGNRVNLLTHWQSIEYITSQNLDRRAMALVNAVTVVPGALGAWRKAAVLAAGGYVPDNLAEDMDLTWRLRRAGWRIETESGAVARTEAPETFGAFYRQRFRWTYGTLQCLWKHRAATFRYGWFGRLSLPTLWVFQIGFQAVAPFVDLQMLYLLGRFVVSAFGADPSGGEGTVAGATVHPLLEAGFYYALFFAVDLAGSLVAFRLDHERPIELWRLFWQRFVYRQILYAVLWKSLVKALQGLRLGWGKLARTGSVQAGGGDAPSGPGAA
jgi:glycosyltransferase involved in cell wall biosynthesis